MDGSTRRVVVDMSFERALEETIRALRLEGLEVVSRFNVRQFLEGTLHHDFRQYVLLDAAPAQSMLDALREDLSAGPIVPTRIAVFELADGETAVVVAEPFGGMCSDPQSRRASPQLAALADRTCSQLARALDRLQRTSSSQPVDFAATAVTQS